MARNQTRFMESAVALSEELSFTLAAIKINVSQSTITKNIKALERTLGVQLFVRDRKGVSVTDAGRAYVEHARKALLYGERAFTAALAVAQEADVVQHVGRSPYTDPFFLSMLMSIRLPLYPQLKIEVSSQFSYDLVHELMSGRLDLAIANEPPSSAQITKVQIAESPFYIGMLRGDELANQPSVTLHDLRKRRWILFARRLHPPLYDALIQQAEQQKVPPTDVQHITSQEEAFPFLFEGNSVAFLTKAGALLLARNGVTVRPLAEETLSLKTYLVSLGENRSKVTSELERTFMRKLRNLAAVTRSPIALTA
ncbi:LysR family transcriptional regulator [Silvibacterium acidisoli]|uniref:LysR family transcriptional regulator n=1 Tax=Acidobacteriaceae bacterium ZG23-2 TaxID=2883246 RepID=UPI00406CEC89